MPRLNMSNSRAASTRTPSPNSSTAAAGTSAAPARDDHVHTGQKLAAIASPTGGLTVDTQARAAIDSIRAVLTAHGLTL